MKSKLRQRIIALVLCMVLVLSGSVRTLLIGTFNADEITTESTSTSDETATSVTADSAAGQADTSTQSQDTTTTSEVNETPAETAVATPVPVQEEMQLTHEIVDQDNNLVCRITADIPAETFAGIDKSAVTMNVSDPDEATTQEIKTLMEKSLTDDQLLGSYFFYNIMFQVNGVTTEPAKAIKITFEQSNFTITDVNKTTAFYYNPANYLAENTEAQLMKIFTRAEVLTYLQDNSLDVNTLEDYDLTDISLKEDGTTLDKITMEGRRSTVYGYYIADQKPVEVTPTLSEPLDNKDESNKQDQTPIENNMQVGDNDEEINSTGIDNNGISSIDDTNEALLSTMSVDDGSMVFQWNNSNKGNANIRIKLVDIFGNDISSILSKESLLLSGTKTEFTIIDLAKELGIDTIGQYKLLGNNATVKYEDDSTLKSATFTSMAIWRADDCSDLHGRRLAADKTTIRSKNTSNNLGQRIISNDDQYVDTVYFTYYKEPSITVKFVDQTGEEIHESQEITPSTFETTSYNTADFAKLLGLKSIGDYVYDNAKVEYQNGDDVMDQAITQLLKYSSDTINDFHENSYPSGVMTIRCKWSTFQKAITEQDTIYFVYKYVEPLTTVDTVDSTADGITMRMIDLVGSATGNYPIGLTNESLISLGGSYGNGTVKAGLLEKVLGNDGYPVSINDSGKSLSSLFAGGTNVNHLFRTDILESTGYYEYSSFNNYAYLNENGDFTVYDQIGTPDNTDKYFYQRGNFMPYNNIEAGKLSTNTNRYGEDGETLDLEDARRGEALYKTQGENDYQFGMYMEAKFSQPSGGIISDTNKAMRYEFNGDDDLWIYIDNVLILDIGGVHDAHSGYIDFSTGEVGVYDCTTTNHLQPELTTTSIKALYQAAQLFPDGTAWDDSKVDDYFEGDTLKDYTTHSFKMFYMERGTGASNLHMKFNLQVVPEGTIEVKKKLSNTDKENYANVDFGFQVYAQKVISTDDLGQETYSDTEYEVLKSGAVYNGTTSPVTFAADGTFYLKAGQSAKFSGLQGNRKYYVTEVNVSSEEYDEVKINGDPVIKDVSSTGETTGTTHSFTSSTDSVLGRPIIEFTNNCSVANSNELRITKRMYGNQTSSDTFAFKVMLSNQESVLVPYAGDYYLQDANQNYYTYQDGELIQAGDSDQAVVCGSTSDGIIRKVPVGYTVSITKILSGTKYSVEEYALDMTKYETPEISPSGTGTIELKKNTEITVTNKLSTESDSAFIRVQKRFVGLTTPETQVPNFNIELYKADTSQLVATLTLTDALSKTVADDGSIVYEWTVANLTTGSYVVKENGKEVTNYTVSSSVNGQQFNEDGSVTVETQEASYLATDLHQVNKNSSTDISFAGSNFIAAKLKAQTGYLIWTKDILSSSERVAIIKAINKGIADSDINGNMSINTDKLPIAFFSSENKLENGIVYGGGTISVVDDKIVFDDPSRWEHVCYGKYTRTGSVNADIELTNNYGENQTSIDLIKYGSSYNGVRLTGAKFSLYKGALGTDQMISWDVNPMIGYNDIEATAAKELSLTSGYYMLKETVAPTGYTLLTEPVYFRVYVGVVGLTNSNGKPLSSDEQTMWKLSGSSFNYTLSIKNNIIYALPSTGGVGIYWYSIGGVLLMLAAILILYRKRNAKEVPKR